MISRELRTQLLKRVTDPIEAFASLGDTIETTHGPLTYIDRGADVLAVAHLDFVCWTDTPRLSRSNKTLHAGQLDDRLGAWVILDLLPALGVNVDILLTDSEEIGCSTAQFFKPVKEYNWMVQFDRNGTDTVMYDYDCEENRKILRQYGFDIGWGSFTDLCYLDHLKVSGFNVGTGYYRQHSDHCHAYLRETLQEAKRFRKFWNDYQNIRLPAPEKPIKRWSHQTTYDYDGYYSYGKGASTRSYNESPCSYPIGGDTDLMIPEGSDDAGDGKYLSKEFDRYILSELLKNDGLEYQCPSCLGWNDSPISCEYCGARYKECVNCGEVLTNWELDCDQCGTRRTDITESEFIAQFS